MTASLCHLARLCALLLPGFPLWSGPPVPAPALEPVPLGHVTVDDAFWAPKLKVCREATIPHSWQYLQGELRALRKAGGQPVEGELNGTWGEANLHKFLETVACALQIRRDPALERQMDEVIALLRAAQQPDGYLHAYVTNNRKVPWDPAFLDGIHTYYCNPLSDRDHRRDNCWVCCPPNLSRTLLQIGRYAFAHTDRDLYVNLFVGGAVRVPLAGGDTTLRVETGYPWDGRVKITVDRQTAGRFALHVRRPGWCAAATLALNGQRLDTPAGDAGYWTLDRPWKAGDVLEVGFDLPVVRLTGHLNIAACRGRVALQRGPLVYGFEGLDNDGQPGVRLGPDPGFAVAHHADLLGGVTVIEGRAADGRRWRAVPFYALANRGPSSQEVWVEQQDGEPPAGWWLGNLYRPMSR